MFILSPISSGLEFWSVNHTPIYKNSELKVFKSTKFLGEISNNWPKNFYWKQMCVRVLNLADNVY